MFGHRPWLAAIVVFIAVLAVGVAVLFAVDAFPSAAHSAYLKGRFAGQTVGVGALFAAVVTYFVVRSRGGRR